MDTVEVSLTDDLVAFVEVQAAAHGYASASEYVCELVRRQRDVEGFRQTLLDGASSGTGEPADSAFFMQLHSEDNG